MASNSFNFLAFGMMKTSVSKIDILNMNIVYHWILQVHSMSGNVEIYSCLVTVSASVNCCKARLVTNDFYLVCMHIINITNEVTSNKIIVETNRKNIYSIIIKKEFS